MRTHLSTAALLLVTACGAPGVGTTDPAPADVARIACTQTGTRVDTPEVLARPDGVHLRVENELSVDPGFSVSFPSGGGMGDNVPPAGQESVYPWPPGTIEIGCDDPGNTERETITIVDPGDHYRAVEPECGFAGVSVGSPSYSAGAKGDRRGPVEIARDLYSRFLGAGDIVERAGYPEAAGEAWARAVRDGRVIAVVHFFEAESGGWHLSEDSRCGDL